MTFFVDPIVAITKNIQESAVVSTMSLDGAEAIKKNVEKGGSLFGSISSISINSFLSAVAFFFATIGVFLFSLIQQIYIVILYVVGPLIAPFFIFEPFSDIFINWIKKVLGTLMWSIFGLVMLSIIWVSGMWTSAMNSVGDNDVIMSAVLCFATAMCCWKIPDITSQIVGAGLDAGLSPKSMAGAATGAATMAAKGVATGGASVAGDAAGAAASHLSKSGS